MSSNSGNNGGTIILFNDKFSKVFAHKKAFKRLLGTKQINISRRYGKDRQVIELLLNAMEVNIQINSKQNTIASQRIECTHVISIPIEIQRNTFFDLQFNENVVGSFTTTNNDLNMLHEYIRKLDAVNTMQQKFKYWLYWAVANKQTLAALNLTDKTVSDLNINHLSSLSDTYGLQALTECQSMVTKWIDDHRWRYIG